MFKGVATVRLHAADHEAAKRWYTEVLGCRPYFDRPGYAEFRIGDYQQELGLLDSRFAVHLGSVDAAAQRAGAVVYWHVDDVNMALARLVSLGARPLEAPRDFGRGFVGASVEDPFGNVLGLMQNPHYLEVLAAHKP